MKYEEALEKIKEMKVSLVNVTGYDSEFLNAIEEAVEKQIPIKTRRTTSTKRCGRCNKQLSHSYNSHPERKFCSRCGQATLWYWSED